MSDKPSQKKPHNDPAQMALEAANQALAAANAAVQAAVKALAMSSRHHDEEEQRRSRAGGSIRRAASQARRSAGDDGSGDAPLSKPPARARRPAATPARPAATPRTASHAAPAASPDAPAASHAAPAAPPVEAPPPPVARTETPSRTRIRKDLEPEAAPSRPPRPLPTESTPRTGDNGAAAGKPRGGAREAQAVPRPAGSGPIHLGPSTASAAPPIQLPAPTSAAAPPETVAPPAATPETVAPPAAPAAPSIPAVDPAETSRLEAALREREQELAAREAAMARYAPMEPAQAVPARPQAEPNGFTVLVVDDEEQVRALTVRILTRFGYQVLEAPGVEIALGLLDQAAANVDLVLSDVAMPGLSGKDLFRAISESRPGLPVVFMSGYALGVYAPEGLIEEGVKMLPKPFTQEDLLGFVTEALEGAAAG